MISRSSAEFEYKAMTNVTLELIWIRNLLVKIGFLSECLMRLYGDNNTAIHIAENAAIHIAENAVLYERTTHIEVDCHMIVRNLRTRSLWRSIYHQDTN